MRLEEVEKVKHMLLLREKLGLDKTAISKSEKAVSYTHLTLPTIYSV